MNKTRPTAPAAPPVPRPAVPPAATPAAEQAPRPAPDPTRYGDWEIKGRCIDF